MRTVLVMGQLSHCNPRIASSRVTGDEDCKNCERDLLRRDQVAAGRSIKVACLRGCGAQSAQRVPTRRATSR